MGQPYGRLTIGGAVHAKAIHIKNYSECARMYGSAAYTKWVDGGVTAFSRAKNASNRLVTAR